MVFMVFPVNRLSLLLILLLTTGFVWSQNAVQTAVDAFAGDPVFAHANVGFLAIDVATGEVVASKTRQPASRLLRR